MQAIIENKVVEVKKLELQEAENELKELIDDTKRSLATSEQQTSGLEKIAKKIEGDLARSCMDGVCKVFGSNVKTLTERLDALMKALKRVQFLTRFPKRLDVSFLKEEVLAYAVGEWIEGERKIAVRVPRYAIFTLDFPFFGINLRVRYWELSEDWEKRHVLCFGKNWSRKEIPEALASPMRDVLFSEKESLLTIEKKGDKSSDSHYYFSRLVVPLPLAPNQETERRIRELEREFAEEGGAVFLIAEAPRPWHLAMEKTVVPIPSSACPLVVGVLKETVFFLGSYSPTKKEGYVTSEFVV